MSSRSFLAACAVLALSGCAPLPYDMSVTDWQLLTPQQRVELRRQWFLQAEHRTGMVTPAAAEAAPPPPAEAPLVAANRRLEQENADLHHQLEVTEAKLAKAQQEIRAAAVILGHGAEAPQTAAAPAASASADPAAATPAAAAATAASTTAPATPAPAKSTEPPTPAKSAEPPAPAAAPRPPVASTASAKSSTTP